MPTVIEEVDSGLLVRFEDSHGVFEATVDEVAVTDVTLRFYRDDEKIGSVYNDDGTARTMARLTVPGDTDFISLEVPKAFVRELLDTAQEQGRVRNPDAVEGYRLRVLRE
ncbi:hypothetical protein ACFQL1_16735 [Halomicroarcula sp. GCM10025709]|uniref:hypothetical protein n=1 Tax=Haloarcula TaxID=2237 RepID=UPI0024C264CF|nr:hypothetical protein [Halomicroarcula sp. YJ-61-S]